MYPLCLSCRLGRERLCNSPGWLSLSLEDIASIKYTVTSSNLSLPTTSATVSKVRVVASDISRGRMLVLPEDVRDYGIAPEDLEVALAVRMSR